MSKKHRIRSFSIHRLFVLALFIMSGIQLTFSQQLTIMGTVVDKKDDPIIGANIKIKGATKGTISDFNGKFSLIGSKNSELIITYIGMISQTIKVTDTKPLMIIMDANEQGLDEIVVVGYGQSTKRDITGSLSKVNIDDIRKSNVASVTDALGGRIAGVSVNSPDGQPGATANIVIRGSNSLTGDNSPLYVIDGFPLENAKLNSTPPEDIESIEILKDASATAIYGARGANGVIIITTKKGKIGKPVITYDGSYGLQQVTKKMNLMTPYDYVKMYSEIQPLAASTEYFGNGLTLYSYKDMKGTDFQSAIFRVSPMQSHNLAIRGGTDDTKYSATLNYLDQQGVIINGGFNRLQGKVALEQKLSKVLTTRINVGYVETNSYGIIPSQGGYTYSTYVMSDIWGYRPIGNNGTDMSNANVDPNDLPTDLRFNPLININNVINERKNDNLNANGSIEYRFNNYLKLEVSGGINNEVSKKSEFYNSNTKNGNPRNFNGVNGQIIYLENKTWLNENILSYRRRFKSSHNLGIMCGITAQGSTASSYGAKAVNCPYETLGLSGLDYGTPSIITSTSSEWKLLSYLGRVNYDYKSKYLLTASFRADGSSKFAKDNKWSYFPSGSFAWRMSEERFIKDNLNFVSDLKLRTSYGITGNNRVPDFASKAQMNGEYYYNGTSYNAIVPTTLANTLLRWESTTQTNIGVDLGMFAQRVTLTVDAYRKVTNDLLFNSQMPGSSGFTYSIKNIGSVQNQGLEFTLNTINIKTQDFQWNSNFNISFNQNKVLKLADGQNSYTSYPGGYFSPTLYAAIVGQPMAQIVGYVWDKVYQYSDFDVTPAGTYVLKNDVTCNSPSRSNVVQPGYIKFRDLNGDGIINTNDLAVIGNPFPKHIGGFTNSFNYKGLELSVFFQWSYGNDIYNANRDVFESGRLGYQTMNHFASFNDRWSPDNQTGVFPIARGDLDANYASTRCVEDGSYLRLKTVSLGYTFGNKLVKKLGFEKLRVYTSAQNLYTWTKYTGYDPEVSANGSSLMPGFDFSTYPRAATVSFGVNAAF